MVVGVLRVNKNSICMICSFCHRFPSACDVKVTHGLFGIHFAYFRFCSQAMQKEEHRHLGEREHYEEML